MHTFIENYLYIVYKSKVNECLFYFAVMSDEINKTQ
nr:MAG TPA: hypothetical protein [Caudoviricetes sp.]